jgi:hypothetical protein
MTNGEGWSCWGPAETGLRHRHDRVHLPSAPASTPHRGHAPAQVCTAETGDEAGTHVRSWRTTMCVWVVRSRR